MFDPRQAASRSRTRGLFASIAAVALLSLSTAVGCNTQTSNTEKSSENLVSTNNAITQAADETRTGWFPDQPGLAPAIVGSTNFGQLFKTPLPLTPGEQVLAQPLVYGGKVLVVTAANNLYLVNETTGAITNQRALGTAFNVSGSGIPCGDINPTVGVIGTPVIDNATGTAYFYSKSSAGVYTLHAVDATTLNERANFPITIGGAAQNDASATFNSLYALQRPGLLSMGGVIYAAFGSHCDQGPYRGWIFGVDKTTGAVKARWTNVANTPGVTRGNGIWMSGAGLSSDGAGRIFFSTGNGYPAQAAPYAGPIPGNTPPGDLEESVVRVNVQGDGTLQAMDFFAPYNAQQLNGADADLGSGGVVLLPPQFGAGTTTPKLAVVAGKGGYAYLLNRDNLGGHKMGPAQSDNVLAMPQLGGATWSRAAAWPGDGGYVYITTNGGGGTPDNGYRLQVLKYGTDGTGKATMSVVGKAPDDFGSYSGSPIVTSNGTTSGSALVWATNLGSELRVYDAVPVNGTLNIRFRKSYGNQAKFTTVGVGSGKVYVGSGDGYIVGYGVANAPVNGPAVAFGTVAVNTTKTLTATITATGTVTVNSLGTSNPAIFTLGASAPALPVTLTNGQSITVPVSFKPTAASGYSALLNVVGPSSTLGTIALSGSGQLAGAQLIAQPMNVNFGGVVTGTTKTVAVVLTNSGSSLLTFSGFTNPAAPFGAANVPAAGVTLAAGASVTLNTTYSPTQVGIANSSLIVNSNGGNVTIPLTGTGGTPANLVITPLNLAYGSIAGGTTKNLSFTMQNTGGVDLTITKSKPPSLGQFNPTTTLNEGAVLTAGQTITQTVAFSSAAAGTFADAWQITGSDATGLQVVNFTGTVTAAATPLSRTGWIASASTVGDPAGNALDGNAGSRFSTGQPQSGAATNTFTVDMLAAKTFTQITLDSGNDYARNYQVFASNDQANWGTAIATGTGTGALTTIAFAAKTARYVQVRQTTSAGQGAWWSIYEFNVYGSGGTTPPDPGGPISRTGWVLSASSTGGADVVGNAIDGAAGTRWSSGQPQSNAGTQTFTIDLTAAKAFDKIVLESGADYARTYSVFASNDQANWGTAIATGTGTGATTTITFAEKNARYIQIRAASTAGQGAWWSIYEVNVYAPGSGGGGTALSRTGWTATGSAVGDPPGNALDGVIGSRWSTGAAQVPNQYFQVDMQSAKTFKSITLDAAGSAADYPRGYQVFVSADGVTWGTAVATGTPTTALVTITFTAQTARFIKVVQTGTVTPNWWSLYEFNVYN